MTTATYNFSGYRRGSTNGQRSYCAVIVTGAQDKAAAKAAALAHLGCYKVMGSKVHKSRTPEQAAQSTSELRGYPVDIIECN